jgi:osmotically-inducible protein OsmY
MRTDNELRTGVVAELSWDPSIRDEDIATAVKDGVVTLAGLVDDVHVSPPVVVAL